MLVSTGLAVAAAVTARASSDAACIPQWKLDAGAYSCAGRAMLAPGNDTRINMLLLVREEAGSGGPTSPAAEGDPFTRGFGASFFDWAQFHRSHHGQNRAGPGEDDLNEFAGSRCASLRGGAGAFGIAIAANPSLAAGERERLVAAHDRLDWSCRHGGAGDSPAQPPWPDGIASDAGREFLDYLQAAEAFYDGRWPDARRGFATLRAAGDPWVRETAAYMAIRVELNAAQDGAFDDWGGYGGPARVDQAAVGRARAAIDGYLGEYPGGRYAASARGLVRRALWLAGDARGLARSYEQLMAAVDVDAAAADLVQEIDTKLPVSVDVALPPDTPLLLATRDLMAMRAPADAAVYEEPPARTDAADRVAPALTAEALAAQAQAFAGSPALHAFLRATHAYYVGGDVRRVLQLVPADNRRPAYAPLAFSAQVLRGMALAALRDPGEAAHWLALLGGADPLHQRPLVELGVALNYERTGRLAAVFAADSPVTDSTLRQILLQHSAGPALLRAQAADGRRPRRERDVALFTLLYKELSRGRYADFAADVRLVPAGADAEAGLWFFPYQDAIPLGLFAAGRWSDGYRCPAVADTAAALARDPRDAGARLCLGDFFRLNGFDDFEALDTRPAQDELGGAAAGFPGERLYRGSVYGEIMDDPRLPADDRAYALYRAVRCYAPAGINSCGGADVGLPQRRAWFERLKREFPASPWAKKLRNYW